MNEYKPLKECNNYLISKDGNVFSKLSNKRLKPFKMKIGYYAFDIWIEGKSKLTPKK